jgi:hypothetical protein
VRLLLDYEAGLDCSGRRTLFDVAYAAKRDDTLWVLIKYGITERREALEELPTINADSLPDWAFDKVQVNICHRPRRSVGGRSDLQRAVPGRGDWLGVLGKRRPKATSKPSSFGCIFPEKTYL